MDRIILHWSAGTNIVSGLDRQHYHYIIDGGGVVSEGDHAPEDNLGALRPGHYAAHTLNCNTGSIGIALAGMAGAVEAPFSLGRYPITDAQVEALTTFCARLCRKYSIPVTRRTVLSHAEVQPTLGIQQRGKWDIAWLPGMSKPGDPVVVGDILRERVIAAMIAAAPRAVPEPSPTIRRGDVGSPVTHAQRRLRAYGYDLTADGAFGRVTEAAVKGFQAKRGLPATGVIDATTWSRLLA